MTQIGFRLSDSSNQIDMPQAPLPDGVDLGQIAAALRRQRWVIVLSVAVAVLFGMVFMATTPKLYLAGSTVLVGSSVNRAVAEVTTLNDGTRSEAVLESEVQVIRSQRIALAVVDALALHQSERFLSRPTSLLGRSMGAFRQAILFPIKALQDMVSGAEVAQTAPATPSQQDIDAAMRLQAAELLQSGLHVSRSGRSTVFSINFISHDAGLSALIANAYAEAYVADLLNANFEATELATQWLQTRLDELQAASEQAARDAEQFRAENGLLTAGRALLSESSVVQLNAELSVALAETARISGLLASYDRLVARGPEAFVASGAAGFSASDDPRIAAVRDLLAALTQRLAQIEQSFGPDHAQAGLVRDQIAVQTDALFGELLRLQGIAQSDLAVSESRVAALRDSIALAQDENSVEGEALVQLRALEQREATMTALYQTFLARFQEINQQKTFPVSNVRILSRASPPGGAFSPRTSRVLAMMIVLGLIIGACIGVVREYRDRFLRTGEDVQRYLGAQFLGYLPRFTVQESPPTPATIVFRARDAERPRPAGAPQRLGQVTATLQAVSFPRSHFAETLRNTWLTAEVALAGRDRRVIGFTSVRPGEGKTTAAANFAALLATSGQKVVLIDADPRRPGLTRSLGIRRGPGLVEVVLGKCDWRKALRNHKASGLHILPCLSPPQMAFSSELLGTQSMRALVDDLALHYDVVVLDLSPLGPVVDAKAALPMIDRVVLVAEWGKTPRALLRATLALETAVQARLLGVLLNQVDMQALPAYTVTASAEHYLEDYVDYFEGNPDQPARGAA